MDLKYRSLKEIFVSVFVGFSIGLSIIVPGISGSTIAIIMKVYDKLMYSFSNIFKKFKICFIFLIPIGIGAVLGFAIGFVLVMLLLEAFPFITICFFVGLMAGTYPILLKEIKGEKITAKKSSLFLGGILVPIIFGACSFFAGSGNSLIDLQIGHYILFVVIGVLISLTQIIPGLSATVLLMIFGYYTALLNGVKEVFDAPKIILVYLCLILGFVIGIIVFSKGINYLLENHKMMFFFVICGLSLGSMVSVFIGSDCLTIYKSWTSSSAIVDATVGALMLALGFAVTFAFYIYDKKREKKAVEKSL